MIKPTLPLLLFLIAGNVHADPAAAAKNGKLSDEARQHGTADSPSKSLPRLFTSQKIQQTTLTNWVSLPRVSDFQATGTATGKENPGRGTNGSPSKPPRFSGGEKSHIILYPVVNNYMAPNDDGGEGGTNGGGPKKPAAFALLESDHKGGTGGGGPKKPAAFALLESDYKGGTGGGGSKPPRRFAADT